MMSLDAPQTRPFKPKMTGCRLRDCMFRAHSSGTMTRAMTTVSLLALACALTVLSGCMEDFLPQQRLGGPSCGTASPDVDKDGCLRVLAIRSQPVDPAPGDTTVLTPLVFPFDSTDITYEWSWCPVAGPADDGYPCLDGPSEAFRNVFALAGGTLPPADLGGAPEAAFSFNIQPQALALFETNVCQADVASATMPGTMPAAALVSPN